MPAETFNDYTVHYSLSVKAPERPALVLVHGAGGSHRQWPLELMGDDRTLLALDLPGHGASGGAGCTVIADYVQVLAALLERLRTGPAVICGHSMGGAIAQTLALMRPDLCAGLILVATGPRLPVMPQILEGLLDAEQFARGIELISKFSVSRSAPESLQGEIREQMSKMSPSILHGDFTACNAFDVEARLGEINVPVLVLCGKQDKMTPVKFSQSLADALARAQLTIIPDAGHYVMMEQPEQFARAVRDWLAAV